jgi:hypothetical protein
MHIEKNIAQAHYGNLACADAIAACVRRASDQLQRKRDENKTLTMSVNRMDELYAGAQHWLGGAGMIGSRMLFCFEMPREDTSSGGWQAAHIAACALLDESIALMNEEAQRAADAVKRGGALQPIERLQAANADTMHAAARQAQDIFRQLLELMEQRRVREWAARNRVSGGGQPERTPAQAITAYQSAVETANSLRDLGRA